MSEVKTPEVVKVEAASAQPSTGIVETVTNAGKSLWNAALAPIAGCDKCKLAGCGLLVAACAAYWWHRTKHGEADAPTNSSDNA